MKHTWQTVVVILMLASIFTACSLIPLAGRQKIIPEAEPVFNWLKAVKTSDPDLLKTVFSERMIRKFKDKETDWTELLNIYSGVFSEKYGEYNLEDFSFTFEGGSKSGNVIIFSEVGSSGLTVYVIKEKKGWKVNER